MVIRKRKEREYPIRCIVCKCVAVCIFPLSVEEKVEKSWNNIFEISNAVQRKGNRKPQFNAPTSSSYARIYCVCVPKQEGRKRRSPPPPIQESQD